MARPVRSKRRDASVTLEESKQGVAGLLLLFLQYLPASFATRSCYQLRSAPCGLSLLQSRREEKKLVKTTEPVPPGKMCVRQKPKSSLHKSIDDVVDRGSRLGSNAPTSINSTAEALKHARTVLKRSSNPLARSGPTPGRPCNTRSCRLFFSLRFRLPIGHMLGVTQAGQLRSDIEN